MGVPSAAHGSRSEAVRQGVGLVVGSMALGTMLTGALVDIQ